MSELDLRLVFAKTPRGSDAIARRDDGLSAAARRILILIDGRRRLMDLAPFARPGDLEPIVEDLQARELIVLAGIAEAPDEREIGERRRREREAIASMQRVLAGAFAHELGADGLVLDARLRDCVSLEVMRRLLREAVDTVARHRGEQAAQRLLARIRDVYRDFAQSR